EATDFREISVNISINNGMRSEVVKAITNESPVFLQKEEMRKRLNLLAKRVALKMNAGRSTTKPDFKIAHRLWIDNGGKSMELETVNELNQRIEFYQRLLRS
ncbi:MAG: hypothetical protein PHX51_07040, partial [Clostridia bacterium]|nr:hypothetical protein [Clostridia bacterium]